MCSVRASLSITHPVSRRVLIASCTTWRRGLASRKNRSLASVERSRSRVSQHVGKPIYRLSTSLQNGVNIKKNALLAPVKVPYDGPGVIMADYPSASILANPSIIVQRQMETMNLLIGYEQANRYVLMDPLGTHIGYLAEQEHGVANAVARQTFRTHRSFTTHVFDRNKMEVLRFHRPFSWISSLIQVLDALPSGTTKGPARKTTRHVGHALASFDPDSPAQISSLHQSQMQIIGAARQQWAPWRRKYSLYLSRDPATVDTHSSKAPNLMQDTLSIDTKAIQDIESDKTASDLEQFAHVDETFLSWDFSLRNEDDTTIGSVNRNSRGFAREVFTDTGAYALRMDSSALEEGSKSISMGTEKRRSTPCSNSTGMTLDQRAVMLATAVSIDFDYFSRIRQHGTSFMPIWIPGSGGEAAGAGAAGAVEATVGEADGAVARDASVAGENDIPGWQVAQGGSHGGGTVEDSAPFIVDPAGSGDAYADGFAEAAGEVALNAGKGIVEWLSDLF